MLKTDEHKFGKTKKNEPMIMITWKKSAKKVTYRRGR